jgi:hypothetical protein
MSEGFVEEKLKCRICAVICEEDSHGFFSKIHCSCAARQRPTWLYSSCKMVVARHGGAGGEGRKYKKTEKKRGIREGRAKEVVPTVVIAVHFIEHLVHYRLTAR